MDVRVYFKLGTNMGLNADLIVSLDLHHEMKRKVTANLLNLRGVQAIIS